MKNYKKNLSTLFVFLTLSGWANFTNADDAPPPACVTAADVITITGTDDYACLTEPDIYKVKVYEMGLCATAPTLANFTTSCTAVTKIATGGLLTVATGVNAVVPGTFTRPDNGVYGYAYMVLAPEFRLTSTKTFSSSMMGYKNESTIGNDGASGTTCWTRAVTTRDSNRATAYNGVTPTPIINNSVITYLAACGAAENAAPGETIFVQDAFGGSAIGPDPDVDGVATAEATVGGTTVNAYLTDATFTQATDSDDVTRLVGFLTFATPVTVTDDSSSFISSFKVTQGTQIAYTSIDNEAGVSTGRVVKMGSGPFVVDLIVN